MNKKEILFYAFLFIMAIFCIFLLYTGIEPSSDILKIN